jgi:DNA-binding NtrC family response regulator
LDKTRFHKALQQALRNRKRPVVLHIEDDLDMVQVTQLLLEDTADYHYVASLHAAREFLNNPGLNIDLVILDLTLPDGAGVELFNDIKARCPVVVLSEHEADKDIAAQAAAALTKSKTSSEQLLATIKHILEHSQEEL